MPKPRKACGQSVMAVYGGGNCAYPRMKGKQQCEWHWLLRQPAAVQRREALARLQQNRQADGYLIPRVSKGDWPEGERWCAGCQSFVPLFYTQGSRCRSCNSEAAHAGRIEKVYGITSEQYDALFELQGGRCYICHRTARSRRLAVDHDHATGEVRGLLCSDNKRGCNHAILGNIKDLAMAKRVVEYLEDPPFGRLERDEIHPDRLMCQAETRDDCDDDSHWERPSGILGAEDHRNGVRSDAEPSGVLEDPPPF